MKKYGLKNWTFLLVTLFLFQSCSDKADFETYFSYTGIEFKEEYQIDSIEQSGFTDWNLDAYIEITENEKQRIINELKKKTIFYPKESEKVVLNNINRQKDSIIGYITGPFYYYSYFKPRFGIIQDEKEFVGFETFMIRIDTNTNKLIFNYFSE